LENLPDGNVQVKLVTGEIFRGDPLKVTQQIAESKVRTTIWARQKVAEAQTAQPIQQIQQPQQGTEWPGADDPVAGQAAALAQRFGFADESEMVNYFSSLRETVRMQQQFHEQQQNERLAAEFAARVPEFPGTDQAAEVVANIVDANGWQWNADSLQAAHLLAVQNHIYQPLSQEQIQAASGHVSQPSRPAAPPMLQGGNPEVTHAAPNPFEMPLQDLRKAAIRQQLESGGPNYR
jgi:hypothetical protein